MVKKLLSLFLILGVLISGALAGTTGKISGTITTQDSGEPLIGVNVVVEGSTVGASTDEDGYYSILNVPVGTHMVHVSYIGYQDIVQQNVRINLDLTTELNFEMTQQTLELGGEVIVTAERKLIRKNETNTNVIRTVEDIQNLPTRGLQDIVGLTAGVVKAENNNAMNVRGGRGAETVTYIDGVNVTDPYNFAMRIYLPNEAIEELSVQTGGFNAEYGEAMSGIIAITTRVGGEKYHFSAEAISDELLSPEKKTLGAYSYGYNEYVLSLNGPIIPKKKHTFFVSATRQYIADWTPSWGWAENSWKLGDYTYDQPVYSNVRDSLTQEFLMDTVRHEYNFNARLPENYSSRWSYTGKVKLQLSKNMELKSSYIRTNRDYSQDILGTAFAIQPIQYFNAEHRPVTVNQTSSFNVTLTHMLGSRTFYDLKFNMFDTDRKCWDPVFKDNLYEYGDPTYNPWPDTEEYYGQAYTGRLGPDFFQPGSQYDSYIRQGSAHWGIDFDITHQQGKYHNFKAGFEYKYHTVRYFRMLNPTELAYPYYTSDIEKYRGADVNFYGYDVEGNEVDDGDYLQDVVRDSSGSPVDGFYHQAPYHPIIMSGYFQDKIEFEDIILNLGLRYDYLNPNAWMFRQIAAEFDDNGVVIPGTGMFGGDNQFDESDIVDHESFAFISPRLGVSFPVTDQTVFHAQYGKFYQSPRLQDLYLSPFYMDRYVTSGGYFINLTNPNLEPTKTTSYEIGFKQMFGNLASIQLTAFYKETEDLVQLNTVTTDVASIALSDNGDFGTIKGLDVIFTMRRYKNLSLNINYELQFAEGTGSASAGNYDIAWLWGVNGNYPKFAQPLDFEQRHSGSINLDYRYISEAPIRLLRNTGANVMFTFNSGNPYTLNTITNQFPFNGRYDNDALSTTPVSAVNSEITPWNFRIDLKVDKKFTISRTSVTLFAWVTNLLNSRNIQDVWITTGLPNDTGFLGTSAGQAYWNSLTELGRSMYKMREIDYNYYGQPRQIRLGIQIEL